MLFRFCSDLVKIFRAKKKKTHEFCFEKKISTLAQQLKKQCKTQITRFIIGIISFLTIESRPNTCNLKVNFNWSLDVNIEIFFYEQKSRHTRSSRIISPLGLSTLFYKRCCH